MPKLSHYVSDQSKETYRKGTHTIAGGADQFAPHLAKSNASIAPAQPVQQEPEQPSAVGNDQFTLAAKKFNEAFNKRLREHGPRRFRWPDGTLRDEKPPPNPYTAANRRKWASLVEHCRKNGGDRGFETTGQSLRYGLNVPAPQHSAYLQHAQLEPEANEKGDYVGFDPSKINPLDDPQHALNSFYREGAAAVFDEARGRLL